MRALMDATKYIKYSLTYTHEPDRGVKNCEFLITQHKVMEELNGLSISCVYRSP